MEKSPVSRRVPQAYIFHCYVGLFDGSNERNFIKSFWATEPDPPFLKLFSDPNGWFLEKFWGRFLPLNPSLRRSSQSKICAYGTRQEIGDLNLGFRHCAAVFQNGHLLHKLSAVWVQFHLDSRTSGLTKKYLSNNYDHELWPSVWTTNRKSGGHRRDSAVERQDRHPARLFLTLPALPKWLACA